MAMYSFRKIKGIASFSAGVLALVSISLSATGCGGGSTTVTQGVGVTEPFRFVLKTSGPYDLYNGIEPQVISSRAELDQLIAGTAQGPGSGPVPATDSLIGALLSADVDYRKEAIVLLEQTTSGGPVVTELESSQVQEKTLTATIRVRQGSGGGVGVRISDFYVFVVSRASVDAVRVEVVSEDPGLGTPETIRLTVPD